MAIHNSSNRSNPSIRNSHFRKNLQFPQVELEHRNHGRRDDERHRLREQRRRRQEGVGAGAEAALRHTHAAPAVEEAVEAAAALEAAATAAAGLAVASAHPPAEPRTGCEVRALHFGLLSKFSVQSTYLVHLSFPLSEMAQFGEHRMLFFYMSGGVR